MSLPLILALLAAGPADVCPPEMPVPAELLAYREQLYAPGRKTMPVPPPEGIRKTMAWLAAYKTAREKDWADLCHYAADNARLGALPQADRQIVFMGDSITEAWPIGDRSFVRRGWINRGISGQTTPQMLVRFPADVLALKPRVVHIMAGTNDIAGNTGLESLDTIVGNIAAMVTLAKAHGIRVVLAATPPSDGYKSAPAIKPAPIIAELNRRLRALALRERVTFIDYGPVLATPTGALRPDMTFDGTHPDAAGYAAMAPLARAALAAALRPPR